MSLKFAGNHATSSVPKKGTKMIVAQNKKKKSMSLVSEKRSWRNLLPKIIIEKGFFNLMGPVQGIWNLFFNKE